MKKSILVFILFLFCFQSFAQQIASQLGEVDEIALSPAGNYAASSDKHELVIWDIETGKPILKKTLSTEWSDLNALVFSDDGSKLLFVSRIENTSCIIDVKSAKVRPMPAMSSVYEQFFFTEDASKLVVVKKLDDKKKQLCLLNFSGEEEWKYTIQGGVTFDRVKYFPRLNRILYTTLTPGEEFAGIYTILVGDSVPIKLCTTYTPQAFLGKYESAFIVVAGDSTKNDEFRKNEISLMDFSGRKIWKYSIDNYHSIINVIYLPLSDKLMFMSQVSGLNPNIELYSLKIGEDSPELIKAFEIDNRADKKDFYFCDPSENFLFVKTKRSFMLDLNTNDMVWLANNEDQILNHTHEPSKYFNKTCDVYGCPVSGISYNSGGGFLASGNEFFVCFKQNNVLDFITYNVKVQEIKTKETILYTDLYSEYNYERNVFRSSNPLGMALTLNHKGDIKYSTMQVIDYVKGVGLTILNDTTVMQYIDPLYNEWLAMEEIRKQDREELRLKELGSRSGLNPEFASLQVGDYINMNDRIHEVLCLAFFGDDAILTLNSLSEKVIVHNTDKFNIIKQEDRVTCSKCNWKSNLCPICEGKSYGGGSNNSTTYTEDVYKVVIDQYGNATKLWDGTRTITKENNSNSNVGPCMRCGGSGHVSNGCNRCNGRGWLLK